MTAKEIEKIAEIIAENNEAIETMAKTNGKLVVILNNCELTEAKED